MMPKNVLGMIYSNSYDSCLGGLTARRTMGSVPFGGRYRFIDFVLSNNSKLKYRIFPIEVKSGVKYTTKSLSRFKEKYKDRIGESYIIHPRNLIVKDDIVCIPPYMVMML